VVKQTEYPAAAVSDAVMSMARRAGAKITEVEASHVVMISHPDEVTDVVRTASQHRPYSTVTP
jgi:hypothetical protein